MMEQIEFDRLTGIIAFSRAASLGSFTAAARSLSVSPSAISKSIQRLEALLGVKLFTRTTRSISLTPEGRELQDKALTLLQAAEDVVQSVTAAQAEPSGTLKIAASLPIGTRILAPALPEFRRRFPKIKLDIRLSDQYVNLVEERVDVAVRIGQLPDSGLISRTLATFKLGAYSSPSYLAARGTPQQPEDLAEHDCVNFRFQSTGQLMSWTFSVGDRKVELRPPASVVVDVSDAVVELLAAGAGIGITASWIAGPYVGRGLLVPILESHWVTSYDIHAVWPESRRNNPAVKALVSYLAEVIQSPESTTGRRAAGGAHESG